MVLAIKLPVAATSPLQAAAEMQLVCQIEDISHASIHVTIVARLPTTGKLLRHGAG